MPRTLPWLLEPNVQRRVKQEPAQPKRVKREAAPDSDIKPKEPPSSPDQKDFFRSSQTPPTSPAQACPPEEFLMGGLDHDDAWIMVEDEFYAVAQSFTQHLHYAEYIRRKKEAKARSLAEIEELERPTDGRTTMPKELQRKKDAEALAARQKIGLAQIEGQQDDKDGSETDDDDTLVGTFLHGLMSSSRNDRPLVNVRGLKSSTRAAAGFGQGPGLNGDRNRLIGRSPPVTLPTAMAAEIVNVDDTLSEDDDDLDGKSRPIIRPSISKAESETPGRDSKRPNYRISENDLHRTPKSSTLQDGPSKLKKGQKEIPKFKSRVQSLFEDLDKLPEPPRSTNISDRKRETAGNTPKQSLADNNLARSKDVPTFLM